MHRILFLFGYIVSSFVVQASPQPIAQWDFEYKENLVWVNVQAEEKDFKFILDSGCTDYVLDSDAASQLRATVGNTDRMVRRTDKVEKQALTSPMQMDIENMQFRDIQFLVVPLNQSIPNLQKIDGILGGPLFKQFLVQIDYDQLKIRLFTKDSPPSLEKAIEVPLHLKEGLIGIKLKDSKGNDGNFVLDTGSIHGLIISPHASTNFAIKTSDKFRILHAGGDIKARYCSNAFWKIGSMPISGLETLCCEPPTQGLLASPKWAGILGNGFLSRFNVTFDCGSQKLFLQPISSNALNLAHAGKEEGIDAATFLTQK